MVVGVGLGFSAPQRPHTNGPGDDIDTADPPVPSQNPGVYFHSSKHNNLQLIG